MLSAYSSSRDSSPQTRRSRSTRKHWHGGVSPASSATSPSPTRGGPSRRLRRTRIKRRRARVPAAPGSGGIRPLRSRLPDGGTGPTSLLRCFAPPGSPGRGGRCGGSHLPVLGLPSRGLAAAARACGDRGVRRRRSRGARRSRGWPRHRRGHDSRARPLEHAGRRPHAGASRRDPRSRWPSAMASRPPC